MKDNSQKTMLTNVNEPLPALKQSLQEVQLENQKKSDSINGLMNTEELAKYFKLTTQTIWNWVKANKIPYLKINRRYFFKLEEVMKAIEESNQLLMS